MPGEKKAASLLSGELIHTLLLSELCLVPPLNFSDDVVFARIDRKTLSRRIYLPILASVVAMSSV